MEFPCPTNPTNEVEAEPSVTSTSTSTCGKKGVSPELLETVKAPQKGEEVVGGSSFQVMGRRDPILFLGLVGGIFCYPHVVTFFFKKLAGFFFPVCVKLPYK